VKVDYQAIRTDPALRRGLYGLGELTGYLSFGQEKPLSASTVSRWSLALGGVEHRPRRPDYSFADLISMLVVRNLAQLGLKMPDIRAAEDFLRHRYGHKHPFLSIRLKTDGVDVFYNPTPPIAEQLTAANRGGQEVIRPAITSALRGVSYHDGLAAAWSPSDGIVLDPSVQFGEPCIADTRVTTSQLAELAETSDTPPAELAHTYRLPEEQVRRALDFEQKLALIRG
jgi:uncharacterized protein (DUF433 family)